MHKADRYTRRPMLRVGGRRERERVEAMSGTDAHRCKTSSRVRILLDSWRLGSVESSHRIHLISVHPATTGVASLSAFLDHFPTGKRNEHRDWQKTRMPGTLCLKDTSPSGSIVLADLDAGICPARNGRALLGTVPAYVLRGSCVVYRVCPAPAARSAQAHCQPNVH
jgi:hypothetical protein